MWLYRVAVPVTTNVAWKRIHLDPQLYSTVFYKLGLGYKYPIVPQAKYPIIPPLSTLLMIRAGLRNLGARTKKNWVPL